VGGTGRHGLWLFDRDPSRSEAAQKCTAAISPQGGTALSRLEPDSHRAIPGSMRAGKRCPAACGLHPTPSTRSVDDRDAGKVRVAGKVLDGPDQGPLVFEPSFGATVHQRLTEAEVHFSDEGSGTPVLLLHGFPTTHLLWKRVSPALAAADFRAIAPDLVGYGASDAAENVPVDATNQARWQLELLDALRLGAETVVVAHDIGTAVAQLMVARAPARIDKLILIDGVYADRWAMEAVESIRDWDPTRASALSKVLARRSRSWTKSPVAAELLGEMLASFDGERGGRRLIRAAKSLDPQQTGAILAHLRRQPPPRSCCGARTTHFFPLKACPDRSLICFTPSSRSSPVVTSCRSMRRISSPRRSCASPEAHSLDGLPKTGS